MADHALDRATLHGRIAHHAARRVGGRGLELGLDQGHDLALLGQRGEHAAQDTRSGR